jgi:hypothetical protein
MQFPELFHSARFPEASVADHLRFQGANLLWDIEFTRAIQDWELELVVSFMELLYSCPISQADLNSSCSSVSHRKKFDVKSYYKALL